MRDPMREFIKTQGEPAPSPWRVALASVLFVAVLFLAPVAALFLFSLKDSHLPPGLTSDGSSLPIGSMELIGDSWGHGEAGNGFNHPGVATATEDSTAGTPLNRTQPTEETNASQR